MNRIAYFYGHLDWSLGPDKTLRLWKAHDVLFPSTLSLSPSIPDRTSNGSFSEARIRAGISA